MRALILLFSALVLTGPAQDQAFESDEFGVRLKIPQGWNIGSARQPHVMLKLNMSGEFPFKPELLVYEVRLREPSTLMQYREILRHYVQRAFREPRFLKQEAAKAGGRDGFVFTIISKAATGGDAVSCKGIFEISPRRLLAVDGIFPAGHEEKLRAVYDRFVESIELFKRKHAGADQAWLDNFAKAVEKFGECELKESTDELEIMVGTTKVGSYTMTVRPGELELVKGLEIETKTVLETADEKVVSTIRGFLANDLSLQIVEVEELKRGKDKRTQDFWAKSTLKAGKATIDRRINGEASSMEIAVPEHTVLSELAEALQMRLLAQEGVKVAVPVLSAFESEVGYIKIEGGGVHETKVKTEVVKIHVSFLLREDGQLRTYWFDEHKRPMRVTTSGGSVVFKRKE
jgi:hypothetical protein